MAALDDAGGGAQVLDAAVGAAADEDRVHRNLAHRGTGLEVHVFEGALGGRAGRLIGEVLGGRDGGRERHALAGVSAPGDEGLDVGGLEDHLGVENSVLIGGEGGPVFDGAIPVLALGGVGASLDVVEGRLVGGDHAGAGARLDRHVANRHTALHGELADRLTAVLQDVALTAAGADLGDDGEDDVLGRRSLRQGSVHRNRHGLEGSHRQGLSGEHVLNLAGADAEGQRAERAVRGGVGVAAHDRHAGLGQAQLRANDVDDSLVGVAQGVQADAELLGVLTQGVDLGAARNVRDGQVDVDRGRVVILGRDRQIGAANLSSREAQALERLGARHFVHEVEVDVEQVGGAVLPLGHDVVSPHLFCHRSAHCSSSGPHFGDTVSYIRRN